MFRKIKHLTFFARYFLFTLHGTSYKLAPAADYLPQQHSYCGAGEYEQLDTVSLKRLKEVEKLPSDLKEKIYFIIDVTVRDFKASKAYAG